MEQQFEIDSFPPPIPLKWQLTLSGEFDIDSEDHGIYQDSTFIVVMNMLDCDSNLKNHTLETNHNNTLKQYGKYSYNTEIVNIMISGLTRIQSISHDINSVIFKFYYQNKYKYLHLTFKLYQKFNDNICTGKQFAESINEIINQEADVSLICNELINYKYIKYHSCLTEFDHDALNYHSSVSEFKANDDYFYKFQNEIIEQYSKLCL